MKFCLTLLISLVLSSAVNAEEQLTTEMFRQDLKVFAGEFPEIHKNLFHTMTREEFDAAVDKLNSAIPSLKRHEFLVELARIVAMVRDGHTRIRLGEPETGFHFLPLKIFLYTDGLYIEKAPEKYAQLVGAKIIAFEDTKTDDVIRKVSEIIPRDNEWTVKSSLPLVIIQPEILHALRITDNPETVAVKIEKAGKITSHTVKGEDPAQVIQSMGNWVDARDKNKPAPLYLKSAEDLYWYEYLRDQQILYVQYNGVANKPDQPIAQFFAEVMKFAKEHPVDKFILDMRWNGGGNNYLNKPIILEIIKAVDINQKGKLFTIIGRNTFSAAMNAVNMLEKWTNTIFVGEPTGASPNHYGDTAPVKLPNMGVNVHAATLWWQDMDPRDKRKFRAPDIAAEASFQDYLQGRDPAIEAILNYTSEPPLLATLEDLFYQNKPDEAKKVYLQFKRDPKHKFVETEGDINRLGYTLMQKNLYDRAIEVFQWNVDAYPQSFNVYDSLAEAYALRGDRELAIQFYRKALELNPKSASSRAALQKLED